MSRKKVGRLYAKRDYKEKHNVSFTLGVEEYEKLQQIAEQENVTVCHLCRLMMTDVLRHASHARTVTNVAL